MKVVLKSEWMGRNKGSEIDLVDQIANELIRRGTAKPAEPGFRETIEDRQVNHSPIEK